MCMHKIPEFPGAVWVPYGRCLAAAQAGLYRYRCGVQYFPTTGRQFGCSWGDAFGGPVEATLSIFLRGADVANHIGFHLLQNELQRVNAARLGLNSRTRELMSTDKWESQVCRLFDEPRRLMIPSPVQSPVRRSAGYPPDPE